MRGHFSPAATNLRRGLDEKQQRGGRSNDDEKLPVHTHVFAPSFIWRIFCLATKKRDRGQPPPRSFGADSIRTSMIEAVASLAITCAVLVLIIVLSLPCC